MACRISELVVNCRDPQGLATFWCAVLDWVVVGDEGDGGLEIGPPDVGFGGPQPTIIFTPSGAAKLQPLRLHIDLSPTDRDQEAELERLFALGAVPCDVGQGEDATWHVLADPEGNEFCLLRSRIAPLSHP